MKLPLVATLSVLALIQSSQAQNAMNDSWPAPPAGSGFEKIFSYQPTRHENSFFMPLPQIGDKALELFAVPAAIQGRIALTANNARLESQRETVFGLVRVGGPVTAQPRVFYRNPAFAVNFQEPFFSPDGKSALIKTNRPLHRDYGITIWDIEGSRFLSHEPESSAAQSNAGSIFGHNSVWSPGGRYVAYFRRQNISTQIDENPTMCVLDTKSQRSHVLMQVPLSSDWSWTYQGQILVSTLDTTGSKQENPAPVWSVYAVDVQTGTRTRLFENGVSPHESPDGRWIAFFDNSALSTEINGSLEKSRGLYLWDRTTKTRHLVATVDGEKYPVSQKLQWSPDGKTLYFIEADLDAKLKAVEGTAYWHLVFDPKSPASYTISKMELTGRKLQKLAQIRNEAPIGSVDLKGYGLSPDGARLYYEWSQQVGENNVFIGKRVHNLFAVDTRSGAQTPIARLSNNGEFAGWDWHDDSGVNAANARAAKTEAALLPIAASVPKNE